jgi:hypothetical protein
MANFREDGRTSSLKFSEVVKMPHHKSKRNTSYRQRYNALSALEVHTIGKIQHLLFAFFVMLEVDDNEKCVLMMMMHADCCF